MASLHYEPLTEGEMRFLTINTTPFSSQGIDVSMSTVQFDETTEYLALSYTWGSETDRRDIRLNGRSFSVTANLYDALYSMRKRIASASLAFPARIWVDAVCINQGDIPERNKQVARMRDIYARARVVWAFTGVETEHDKEGFKLVTALARTFQGLSQTLDLGNPLPEETSERLAGAIRHPGLQAGWKALGQLLTRPWWTRAWTVQETALAQSAIFGCGELTTDMSEVLLVGELLWAYMSGETKRSDERAADRISEVDRFEGLDVGSRDAALLSLQIRIRRLDRNPEGMDRSTLVRLARDLGVSCSQERAASLEWTEVADFSLRTTQRLPGHTLASVLARFSSRQCGEPLDKIYALLGLARPSMEPSLVPIEYGLPVPVLWRRVVRAHLELYANLDILYLFSGSPTPMSMPASPAFSSWAHECTARWPMNPAALEVKDAGVEFKASLGRSPQVGHQASGHYAKEAEEESLCLKGVAVDVVKVVGRAYDMADPSYIDSVRSEIERQEGLQDLGQAHFHGFDGPALEEWKKLADVKKSFDQLKETAFSLQRDHDNDVVVAGWRPGDGDQEALIRGIWSSMNDLTGKYPTGQGKLDAFVQTLMMDTVQCPEYAPIFHQRLAALNGHQRANPFQPMYFSSGLLGFRFYVTTKGHYGLVPNDVQAGDKVCVLYGGKAPFLLRSIDDTRHAILSWTFVHGLMNGEALATADGRDLGEEAFCLV
jgi:Heterokaryon incompatibility protein (HET)